MIATIHLLYLDPGSGSYLVQAIVAGALGVVFFFRNIVQYIKAFFALLIGKKPTDILGQGKSPEKDAEIEDSKKH